MGEIRQGDQSSDEEVWRALVQYDSRHGQGTALSAAMAGVEPAGIPARGRVPLILDTDIGGDPDDAVAVALAARTVPELTLVVTTDERGGDRARFARAFLRALGRPDVEVVTGRDLGNSRYYCVDGLLPAGGHDDATAVRDVAAAVERVCERAGGGPVRWVGMGPLSNLATVLATQPRLVDSLEITQMGGALNYRNPELAEHNIRLDVTAARTVLAEAKRLSLVISDVTFRPEEMGLTSEGEVYRHLADSSETWARILRAHLDRWYSGFFPATLQHDPLTLSAALGLPFVDFVLRRVSLDEIGRMSLHPDGAEVFMSSRVDYAAFTRWLHAGLGMKVQQPAAHRHSGTNRGR